MGIRLAKSADEAWIKSFWPTDQFWDFGRIWWRYWHQRSPGEYWLVIPECAFAHYKVKARGGKTLYEIAVHPDFRRQGHASRLLAQIGTPLSLKTNADHPDSNAFYQALGFRKAAQINGMVYYEK